MAEPRAIHRCACRCRVFVALSALSKFLRGPLQLALTINCVMNPTDHLEVCNKNPFFPIRGSLENLKVTKLHGQVFEGVAAAH